ncbi:DUF366 family protein [Candidatus Margulisiibacteriota bacterium]
MQMSQEILIKSYFVDKQLEFSKKRFRPLWAKEKFGFTTDHVVAFIGPEMLDMDEKKVLTKNRLHFIISFQYISIIELAFIQNLFSNILIANLGSGFSKNKDKIRYKKQTIALIENIYSEKASAIHYRIPLEPEIYSKIKIGLTQLKVQPKDLAVKTMNSFINEFNKIINTIMVKQ